MLYTQAFALKIATRQVGTQMSWSSDYFSCLPPSLFL
jgi:hypothetical protein